MIKPANPVSRYSIFRDLWCANGCPEIMRIHVKSTGETIVLENGSPVTLTRKNNALFMGISEAEKRELRLPMPVTLTRVCENCKNEFLASRKAGRYCSPRCRVTAARERKRKHLASEADALVARVFGGAE